MPRSLAGFSATNMRAVFFAFPPPPPPPVNAITLSTAGSRRMISTTSTSFWRIAWKEMSCDATIVPVSRPASCCGKKPFGTIAKSATFSPTVASVTSSIVRGWASAQPSVRS
jgi:hypothetical protein